jgi:hypothetical protein
VAITRSLGCENTLARDGHTPVTELQNGRIMRLQNQKAMVTMAGRRMLGRRRQTCIDLASKSKKTKLGQDKRRRQYDRDNPLLRYLTVDLPCQKNKRKENNKKTTNLHSPTRLRGLQPPPDLNPGGQNFTALKVEMLASAGKPGRKQNHLSPKRLRGSKEPGREA